MVAGTSTFEADVEAAARRRVAHALKARARRYARVPASLDSLFPGLGCASPATLVAVASHLVEREERTPRRWFGFGGEVGLLNARAALLLGRTLRRCEQVARSTGSCRCRSVRP